MKKLSHIVNNLQNQLFESVISGNLIYNTCWEDPRIDRELLEINSDSRVVMLTSAGCNALDYLLDDPEQIHCVDINPAQNALLAFKKGLFANNNYQLLWDFFGSGSKRSAELTYHRQIRPLLNNNYQQYWDQYVNYFVPTSAFPSFYYCGTSGNVARLIHNHIQRKGLYPSVLKMLHAESLEEQAYYFEEIEPQIWNTFSRWLVRQHATMTMLGVPQTQRDMIEEKYKGGILDFIRRSLRHVFTKLPLQNNYFWRVYLTGSYTKNCCPNYLLKANFKSLKKRISKINEHTSTLSQFLKRSNGPYSHFLLLDHQDWMAHSRPDLLAEEWQNILSQSRCGTKILLRSAGTSLDFLPDFVFDRITFHPEKTTQLHSKDRVGTYESIHLGVVQ